MTGPLRNTNNDALMEEHRNHLHVAMDVPTSHDTTGNPAIVEWAAKSGYPNKPTSGYRPGSTGSGGGLDHHSEGRATDFGGYNQDGLAAYFMSVPGVIELIHRTDTRDYWIFGADDRSSGAGAAGGTGVATFGEAASGAELLDLLPIGSARAAVGTAIDKALPESSLIRVVIHMKVTTLRLALIRFVVGAVGAVVLTFALFRITGAGKAATKAVTGAIKGAVL